MAGIIMILAISSTYAKILSVSGLLRQLNEIVEAMMRRIGKSCTVILSSHTVEPLRFGNILQPDNLLHHGGHPPEKTVR